MFVLELLAIEADVARTPGCLLMRHHTVKLEFVMKDQRKTIDSRRVTEHAHVYKVMLLISVCIKLYDKHSAIGYSVFPQI